MVAQKLISRKLFFRTLGTLLSGLLGWVWYRLVQIQYNAENQEEFSHDLTIPPGASYYGKYYLYRKGDDVKAFSTVCSHAGCRIGLDGSGQLQCGCHGSRFDAATGLPTRGPALHPLRQLKCQHDPIKGKWIVSLSLANVVKS